MAAPSAPDTLARACAELVAALPSRLADVDRRAVTPDTGTTAAWGNPAIVLRCGVDPPGPTTAHCVAVDGVDWVAREHDRAVVFVTYGREPAVEVSVPRAYAPEATPLVSLADLVGPLPQGRRCL